MGKLTGLSILVASLAVRLVAFLAVTLVAFLAVMLVVGIKDGMVCPPVISSCPGPYISTDTGHQAPADPYVPHPLPVDG